jgi:hypothetical protein
VEPSEVNHLDAPQPLRSVKLRNALQRDVRVHFSESHDLQSSD